MSETRLFVTAYKKGSFVMAKTCRNRTSCLGGSLYMGDHTNLENKRYLSPLHSHGFCQTFRILDPNVEPEKMITQLPTMCQHVG